MLSRVFTYLVPEPILASHFQHYISMIKPSEQEHYYISKSKSINLYAIFFCLITIKHYSKQVSNQSVSAE